MAGAGSLVEFGWCSVAWVMLGGVCLGELGWCVLACRLWDVGWCLAGWLVNFVGCGRPVGCVQVVGYRLSWKGLSFLGVGSLLGRFFSLGVGP